MTLKLPTKLFKIFNKVISKPLNELINLSFIKRIFQNVLKTPEVLLPFKKGYKTDKNNHNHISLKFLCQCYSRKTNK